MSVTELETRIVKMQEWEQLAQDAAAEAEAIRDTIKAECWRVIQRSLPQAGLLSAGALC